MTINCDAGHRCTMRDLLSQLEALRALLPEQSISGVETIRALRDEPNGTWGDQRDQLANSALSKTDQMERIA
jgi:hypothetical protein